eukprot:TRINITY_DN2506_c0_g2_i3.p1 TRINITY_DN2506_c0_g2~~TRINITY_DN2506_c0_g2_i3.p1  ORF type:complete len:452 (+),score=116.98 TRINITY_DN2506_c0_g2_i3:42-1358(+)
MDKRPLLENEAKSSCGGDNGSSCSSSAETELDGGSCATESSEDLHVCEGGWKCYSEFGVVDMLMDEDRPEQSVKKILPHVSKFMTSIGILPSEDVTSNGYLESAYHHFLRGELAEVMGNRAGDLESTDSELEQIPSSRQHRGGSVYEDGVGTSDWANGLKTKVKSRTQSFRTIEVLRLSLAMIVFVIPLFVVALMEFEHLENFSFIHNTTYGVIVIAFYFGARMILRSPMFHCLLVANWNLDKCARLCTRIYSLVTVAVIYWAVLFASLLLISWGPIKIGGANQVMIVVSNMVAQVMINATLVAHAIGCFCLIILLDEYRRTIVKIATQSSGEGFNDDTIHRCMCAHRMLARAAKVFGRDAQFLVVVTILGMSALFLFSVFNVLTSPSFDALSFRLLLIVSCELLVIVIPAAMISKRFEDMALDIADATPSVAKQYQP